MIAPMLFALLLATQSAPTGFSAEELARRTATADTAEASAPRAGLTPEQRERGAQSDTLRAGFVLDPAVAWETLSPDEADVLHRAFGPDRATAGAEIAWFMRGAAVRAAGEDLAGLYHPVADVWLLLHWERAGGVPRVIDAALVPGDALRPPAEAAAWTGDGRNYALALAEADARATARFAALPTVTDSGFLFAALAADRPVHRERALAALRQWVGSLASWAVEPVRRDAWRALHADLSRGGATAGPAASLPMAVRASLAPAAAIEGPDGVSLLLVSPLYPTLYVTADFGPAGAGGRPQLSILNLANAPLPAGLAEGGSR